MARNHELEALIAKSPDDIGNYTVYADWLIQQGDPRGELINAQIKREAGADPNLEETIAGLIERHRADWLGELGGKTTKDGFSATWRRGFLDEITLGESAYQALRPLPVAQVFRGIKFADSSDEDDYEPSWDGAVTAMVEYGVPATLRKVVFDRGLYWDISSTYLHELEPLYAQVPQLEHLEIILGHMNLGAIVLPNLKHFEVWTGGFDGDNMKAVVAATWPALETLLLRFGGYSDYGGTCTVDDVLPLLEAKGLSKVRTLALANSPFIDTLIPHLAKSPLLRQVTSLDLSLGQMSDAGAEAIVANAAAFTHLTHLDVHRNYLSDDAVTALQGVVASVDGGKQEAADDDYRYCRIGE